MVLPVKRFGIDFRTQMTRPLKKNCDSGFVSGMRSRLRVERTPHPQPLSPNMFGERGARVWMGLFPQAGRGELVKRRHRPAARV